jgi:DNA-binding NtrC family response regulator
MSSRSIAGQLVRLLDGLAAPVCLFDDERSLVFANQACADWLEISLDRLIGKTAAYSATAGDGDQAAVNRLCPPPDAFTGRRIDGFVYAFSPNNQTVRRRALFLPLNGSVDASSVPVLVLAASADSEFEATPLPESGNAATTAGDEPTLLHERLIRFQNEQAAHHRLDRFVGDSPAMQLARSQARVAIASGANAVITGPPGSGREELARTIHYTTVELARTQRGIERNWFLLPLDGSLLTGELIASAVAALSAQGRAPAATILILHLDRVPLEMQSEMVRVFMQRFTGLRFLTTSELSPDALLAQGRLHPLLAAAVGTLVIRLPPLAERREDIPLALQRAIEESNAEGKRQFRGFAPEAIDALVAYSWPGNLTELRRYVANAGERSTGSEILAGDLPQRFSQAAAMARRPQRTDEPIVLADFLTKIERELIERALAQAKGNKARAARQLGLTRPRLYRRMVQLGLEEGEEKLTSASQPQGDAIRRIARKKRRQDERMTLSAAADGPDGAAAKDTSDYIEDIPFEEQPE